MGKLFLQRHTRPDVAPQICYGVSDLGLHSDFENIHLPEVISRLNGVYIDKIYSSPLQRCHTLAKEIANHLNYQGTIEVDTRLMELNFGDWELKSWNEIYLSKEGPQWFDNYTNHPTPNGESFTQLVERAKSFLNDITPLNQDIIVVTHSGFCRAMMVALGRIKLEKAFDFELKYGELMELTIG